MKSFFLLLFFLKTIVLTDVPVTITSSPMEIVPEKAISAITGGAAVYISIPECNAEYFNLDKIRQSYPEGCVSGELIAENGTSIKIKHQGYLFGENEVQLVVGGINSIPTDKKFTKVILLSSKELKDVNVLWINGKH